MLKFFLGISVSMTLLFSGEITIAVAANVSYAIEPLKKEFNTLYPDVKINVVLGSSGKLTAQILHGAPYDLFMSADMKYPDRLFEEKLAVTKPVIYAQGSLALLSMKKRDYCAEMFVLKSPDVTTIAIGNPKTAPYGVAAVEALKNAKIYDNVEKKLVYGESVSQTLLYTTRIADIGIVAKSSLFAPQMLVYKEAIHWTNISTSLYRPIDQGMVVLKQGKAKSEVIYFYDFILGSKAKDILKSFGYNVL